MFLFGVAIEGTGANKDQIVMHESNISNVQRQLGFVDEHHHKLYHQFNETNQSPHKKAWMALEVVDGLRNEDVVMLVTSTWGNKFFYLRSRFNCDELNRLKLMI
jgi:hypothetical protein